MTLMTPEDTVQAKVTERRLIRRILQYWLDKAGERAFPTLDDIDPTELRGDWHWCFVIDQLHDHPFPIFSYMGAEVGKYSRILLSGHDDWSKSVLDKATIHYGQVLERRDAVLVEEKLLRFDGKEIAFRAVLLPLSSDGENITQILGAANGKILGEEGSSNKV
ncbi:MAG: PAS domain-containing protein [Alphaproteobacteria bacterium]|nr:MAG: PAS domain-containing protein [Alphaproteobacteria bacterium]